MRQNELRAIGRTGALLSMAVVVAIPAVAAAQMSTEAPAGAAPAPAPAPTLTGGAPATPASKADAALWVLSVRRDLLAGRRVLVRGALRPAGAGRVVALQVALRTGRWRTVDRDATNARGRYRLTWRAAGTGVHRVRVRFGGTRALASAVRNAGQTRVYRQALASWYGPGLYGGHLACGGRLGVDTLGVAHKTLPCGTKVTLRYRGRMVRVPVIDRGPYVGAREFDLTAATKSRLRFAGTGTVMTTR